MSGRIVFEELARSLETKKTSVLITVIGSPEERHIGLKSLVVFDDDSEARIVGDLPELWRKEALRRARDVKNQAIKERVVVAAVEDWGGARVAFELFRPAHRLILVGAGHIAQAAHFIAAAVGLEVTVLDDRASFANRDRFPRATEVICDDFAEALRRLVIDDNTSVVIVTRGHLHDLLALRAVAGRPARYIGLIGSRRRVWTVLEKLREEGYPEEFLDRLYAPIGLDIGAETPEEIGLAIVAEVVAVLRGGAGGHMRWRPSGRMQLEAGEA